MSKNRWELEMPELEEGVETIATGVKPLIWPHKHEKPVQLLDVGGYIVDNYIKPEKVVNSPLTVVDILNDIEWNDEPECDCGENYHNCTCDLMHTIIDTVVQLPELTGGYTCTCGVADHNEKHYLYRHDDMAGMNGVEIPDYLYEAFVKFDKERKGE